MTFSESLTKKLIKKIERIVSQSRLTINKRKTKVRRAHQRQEATGVVVNEELLLSRQIGRYL